MRLGGIMGPPMAGCASTMTLSLNTSALIASGSGVLTTTAAVVTVTGGLPGYTYAWSWILGGASITITSAAAASTTFSGNPPSGDSLDGDAVCTVTDAAGNAVVSATVTITLEEP